MNLDPRTSVGFARLFAVFSSSSYTQTSFCYSIFAMWNLIFFLILSGGITCAHFHLCWAATMRRLLFLRKYFSLLLAQPLSHYSAGCNLGEAQIEFLFTAVREMIVENGTFPTRFDARRDEIFPGPEMIIAFCASVNDPRHLAATHFSHAKFFLHPAEPVSGFPHHNW